MSASRVPKLAALLAAGSLLLGACGGDDDGGDASTTVADTTPPADTAAPATEAATTTTEATTTTSTTPAPVTEGATVVVANASIVGGSAGRMTDAIATAGFATGAATNATDDVGNLEDSVVHHTDDEAAQAVAESLAQQLGGVEVSPMPDPIPVEGGDLGDATVLLLLGNNQADKTLEELSGGGADPGDDPGDDAGDVETTGLVVVVANSSGVGGAAGRMTETLERAGFTVGEATNGTGDIIPDSIVYFTDADGAEDDAATLAEQLGGVETAAMPDPIPTESGELDGDILLVLGTNQADQSLDTLNP